MHLFRLAVIGEVAGDDQYIGFVPYLAQWFADTVIALRRKMDVGGSGDSHRLALIIRLRFPHCPNSTTLVHRYWASALNRCFECNQPAGDTLPSRCAFPTPAHQWRTCFRQS